MRGSAREGEGEETVKRGEGNKEERGGRGGRRGRNGVLERVGRQIERQREKGGRWHVRESPLDSLCVQCTTDCDHSSPTTDGEHTCRRGGGKEENEEKGRGEERREKGYRLLLTDGTLEFIGDFSITPRVTICCRDNKNRLSCGPVLNNCSFIG